MLHLLLPAFFFSDIFKNQSQTLCHFISANLNIQLIARTLNLVPFIMEPVSKAPANRKDYRSRVAGEEPLCLRPSGPSTADLLCSEAFASKLGVLRDVPTYSLCVRGVSFLFENFRNSHHCFFHKGIPGCFNTSKMCCASAVRGDWMCFCLFIDKRNMTGMLLPGQKTVDVCFCFRKEI